MTRKSGTRKRVASQGRQGFFDKYSLYRRAVQSPESDVIFLRKVYRELRGRDPRVLREDFCGTFALSCEWAKLNPAHQAVGLDLDPEPLDYGRDHYWSALTDAQKKRVRVIEADVLKPGLPPSDITIAMNFSYFVFRSRERMRQYFANVHRGLRKNGVFIVDLFGGSLCHDANEEKTIHRGFTYYWDQEDFDPVTNRATFHIHFKVKGSPKQERVFSYDWRMWSIPELREIMHEVGFKKTHVYWEGTTPKGEGDGKFRRTEKGEACQSWIAYIAAEK